jgi:drug/metabolite transporter (DMT)-like permease
MSNRPALAPRLVLAMGIVAVSTASVFIRYAQVDAPSLTIAAFRLGLASLILLPLAWLRHGREFRELNAGDWLWALASGGFLAIHFAAWITSLEYTTVASSVVLVSTSPLWVALAARLFLKERLTFRLLTGLLLAMVGSFVISIAEARSGVSSRPLLGNALALAGALAVSGYWLIGRRLRRHISLVPYVTMVYGFAALALLAAALLLRQPLAGFKTSTYAWLLLLALLPQLLGHSSFNWALEHLPAAYLLLGETPHLLKLAAAAVILAGIYLASGQRPEEQGES